MTNQASNTRSAKDSLPLSWLSRDATAAALLANAHRLGELQAALDACLPTGWAGHCQVLGARDGQLLLGVPNAALATKLRQLGPAIGRSLEQQGWQINGIGLRVQAGQFNEEARRFEATRDKSAGSRERPSAAVAAFEQLQQRLGASSNGPLQQAVNRLLKHALKGRSDG
jgi:hypothetical protein